MELVPWLRKQLENEDGDLLAEVVKTFVNKLMGAVGGALTQRARDEGRIVNVACVLATGVKADGPGEVLGVDVFTTEDGAGWTAFLRGLVARGLPGVPLVVSAAHEALRAAIAAVVPG